MKKGILFVSAVGIGAGLAYALGSNLRREKKTKTTSTDESEKESAPEKGESRAFDSAPKEAASMGRIEDGRASIGENGSTHELDDRGTDQSEATEILKTIRDNAFDASDEKLARALGRPTEEIEEWTSGTGLIDGDVLMKARTLAIQRGLEVQ